MRSISKILLAATLGLALTSTAFADEEESSGGLKLGFYGALPDGNLAAIGQDGMGSVGALLNLGNGLEVGLGLGYLSTSYTRETESSNQPKQTREVNSSAWELIPSVSYTIRKWSGPDWGAGLDIHLASWSSETKNTGANTEKEEPDGIDLAFYPNFFIKAEVVKNFNVGLKAGLAIYLPGEDKDDSNPNSIVTTNQSAITLRTELFFAFYL